MTAKAPDPRRIVPSTRRRDLAIALGCGVVVLGLLVWAILTMRSEQGRPSANQITGTIVARHDIGEREELISIGRKGLKSKEGESGYSFDVKVEPGGRIYEVPVSKAQFEAKMVGEQQTFIRPPSEQR